jgi:hypothetical protein
MDNNAGNPTKLSASNLESRMQGVPFGMGAC